MITLVEIDGNVQGLSSTSLTVGTGSKSFALTEEQPFVKGMTVVATELSAGVRTGNTMTGTITRVTGTTVVVEVASVAGSGTHASWVLDGERTLYLGTESYVSKLADTPSLQEYLGVVVDPGSVEQYIYKSGTTFGESSRNTGDIVCTNCEGELDYVAQMGFRAAAVRIKQIDEPSDNLPTTSEFSGTVLYPDVGSEVLVCSISDRLAELNRPAQEAVFAGTNSGSTGIEGSADGIKGQIKPFCLGGPIFHVPCTLVNESSRIYAVNFSTTGATAPVASFNAVYDEGLLKTKDTAIGTSGDFANLAALQGATIGAGKYATCIAEGLFRFSGAANGVVTCSVTESVSQSGADLVKRLLQRLGLTSSDYVDASFTALETANSSAMEIYCDSDTSVLDLCNEILAGFGAYLFANTDNKFEVGFLSDPSAGNSVHTFTKEVMHNFTIMASSDPGEGIPPKQIKLNYKKNYRPMDDSEFAGGVTPTDRLLLGSLWKESIGATNENITAKHANPPIFTIDSHFTVEADAAAERTRQETLRQTERKFYSFETSDLTTLNLGDIVTIQYDRINLSSGKKVVIMGKESSFKQSKIGYLVWG